MSRQTSSVLKDTLGSDSSAAGVASPGPTHIVRIELERFGDLAQTATSEYQLSWMRGKPREKRAFCLSG